MAYDIRTATVEDLEEMLAVDSRNFSYEIESGDLELTTQLLDFDRFLLAVDDGAIVGIAGSFERTLTLPGLTGIPMAGVTWVSVLATHRRQGILTGLMAGLDEQAAARNEPMMGLLASEGAIYERFGYGVATRTRSIELDSRRATIQARFRPAPGSGPGSVRFIDPRDQVGELVAVFDRYHQGCPGSVSRSELAFRDQHFRSKKVLQGALHRDGFAIWHIEPDWSHGQPNHRLVIDDLIAATPDAHAALWQLLLSIDLVGPISGWNVAAIEDPLPYLLDDPRALRTTDLNDYLWLKATDPGACFRARPFAVEDEFVIGIGTDTGVGANTATGRTDDAAGGRSGDAAAESVTLAIGSNRAEPSDAEPDVRIDPSAVGPLVLGGVSAAELAAGHRLSAESDVIGRLDRALAVRPLPDCRTPF